MSDAPSPAGRSDGPTDEGGPSAVLPTGGFTLDLSSGSGAGPPEAWRRKRKQASPVLTRIVDLTAPKPAPPKPSRPVATAGPPHDGPPRPDRDGPRGRKSGGATLADLLDEETLARLRHDG